MLAGLGLRRAARRRRPSRPRALVYFNRHGQPIWSEPRGRAAGYDHPQFSVHRGALQLVLRDAVRERLGRDAIVTDRGRRRPSPRTTDGVTVQLARRDDGAIVDQARGDLLVGADGIHSAVAPAALPGRAAARATAAACCGARSREAAPFLGGRTMIMAGHQDQKFVCYPITPVGGDGLLDVNWIAELARSGDAPPPQDWNAAGRSGRLPRRVRRAGASTGSTCRP